MHKISNLEHITLEKYTNTNNVENTIISLTNLYVVSKLVAMDQKWTMKEILCTETMLFTIKQFFL